MGIAKDGPIFIAMGNDGTLSGMELYQVYFEHKGEKYSCAIYSTAKIDNDTSEQVIRDIANDSFKQRVGILPDKGKGVNPRNIKISGRFGTFELKD